MPDAVKSLAKSILHKSGLLGAFRFLNRRGARLLMYHRFDSGTDGLREQCSHIRQYYQPVTLNAIANWLHRAEPLPDNAVAITVDDGYRDFLVHGYPVFREFELPVIVYLVSDFLDGKVWPWWNQVEYAFTHTPLRSTEIRLALNGVHIDLDTPEGRFQSGRRVAVALTTVENSERLQLLSQLPEGLQVEIPASPPPDLAPLTWDEVRELAQDNIDFGCHTRTHPILSRISDRSEVEAEIGGSKLRLEQELARPISHFCYPNGSFADFNEQTLAAVKKLEFLTAVTTEPGINFRGVEPFLIRRLSVDPRLPTDYFERLMSGAFRR